MFKRFGPQLFTEGEVAAGADYAKSKCGWRPDPRTLKERADRALQARAENNSLSFEKLVFGVLTDVSDTTRRAYLYGISKMWNMRRQKAQERRNIKKRVRPPIYDPAA